MRPYLDYISPVFLSHKDPRNYKGYPKVQYDIYKVHCRGLYGQPRLYQAKGTYSAENRVFMPYLHYKALYDAQWPAPVQALWHRCQCCGTGAKLDIEGGK